MKYTRQILVLLAMLALAACTGGPFANLPGTHGGSHQHKQPSGQQGQAATKPPVETQEQGAQATQQKPQPRSAADVSSPAVMSLINKADALGQSGHADAAAATLERALDLDPRNPFIYQRLAAARATQGNYGQAEQLAMKSNSLSGGNPYVQAGNWKLIASARRADGNDQGARQASAKAVNYQRATSQQQ